MSGYLITYDLVKTDATSDNYKKLIAAIEGYKYWAHVQDSVWAVDTTATARQVYDKLRKHMHERDRLIVLKSDGSFVSSKSICKGTWLKEALRG